MTLEDIVPPMELCKQIQEGEFSDSALVWIKVLEYINGSQKVVDRVMDRRIAFPCRRIPAPTLQEILREMAANHPNYIREITVEVDAPIEFTVVAHTRDYYDDNEYQYDANAATAALKLWLDLTKGGKDGK